MRAAPFWDITQRWVVILYRRFGTPYRSIFKGQEVFRKSSWTYWPLKMVPIGCTETSVHNYHSTLRNIPEESRSHLHCSGSLKSRKERYSCTLSWPSPLDGGQWLTSRPGRFTPGKGHRYPFNRRLGGPQSRYDVFEKRKSLCLRRFELGSSACSIVSIPMTLSWFPVLVLSSWLSEFLIFKTSNPTQSIGESHRW
jgi:hypothetical protein